MSRDGWGVPVKGWEGKIVEGDAIKDIAAGGFEPGGMHRVVDDGDGGRTFYPGADVIKGIAKGARSLDDGSDDNIAARLIGGAMLDLDEDADVHVRRLWRWAVFGLGKRVAILPGDLLARVVAEQAFAKVRMKDLGVGGCHTAEGEPRLASMTEVTITFTLRVLGIIAFWGTIPAIVARHYGRYQLAGYLDVPIELLGKGFMWGLDRLINGDGGGMI